MRRVLAIVSMVFACGTALADDEVEVLFSWEHDAQKWKGISGYSETGATEGAVAAVHNVPARWSNELQSGYSSEIRTKLTGKRYLAVDVTPSAAVPPGAQFRITAQLIFQDGANTGTELGAKDVASGTTTLVWDYGAYAEQIAAATGWGHIRFITEAYGYPDGQSPGAVHFDHLRATTSPPATTPAE